MGRLRMITQYMNQYLIHPPPGSKQITVTGIEEDTIKTVAERTEGFSGREISKLAIAWQAAAYGTDSATLDADLLLQVLDESIDSKKKKQLWLSKEEVENLVSDSKSIE